jgi:hypothetical protein
LKYSLPFGLQRAKTPAQHPEKIEKACQQLRAFVANVSAYEEPTHYYDDAES